MNYICKSFQHGANLSLGYNVIIESGVRVGDNVKIGHRCTLKSGTIIGNNTIFDDHSITTGASYIGNNVNIRTGAIISRGTILEDFTFIGPGVITNHTKNVNHGREKIIRSTQLLTYIGYGSILGSQTSILAGVYIVPLVIVGGGSVVVRSISKQGVFFGHPAKIVMDLPEAYKVDLPFNAGQMYLEDKIISHFMKYMPDLYIANILS